MSRIPIPVLPALVVAGLLATLVLNVLPGTRPHYEDLTEDHLPLRSRDEGSLVYLMANHRSDNIRLGYIIYAQLGRFAGDRAIVVDEASTFDENLVLGLSRSPLVRQDYDSQLSPQEAARLYELAFLSGELVDRRLAEEEGDKWVFSSADADARPGEEIRLFRADGTVFFADEPAVEAAGIQPRVSGG